jgi:adenylate cyclase
MLMKTQPPEAKRGSLARFVRKVGLWRLLASALILALAVLFARESWKLPVARDWERALYNLRVYATAPLVEQDPRIVEVVYDDNTLAALGKRSPLDRKMLADALTNLDRLGAKGIAIDILLDQPQAEDAYLLAAFRRLHTPTYVGYTSAAENRDQVLSWQQDYMDHWFKRLTGTNVHRASVRVETDRDNVVRSWPDQPVSLPRLFAPALLRTDAERAGYTGALRFQLPPASSGPNDDRTPFAVFPIDSFAIPALADAMRAQIAGRYVLIGGRISDTDLYDTPITRMDNKPVFGLDVHAVMLAQMLDHDVLLATPSWKLWLTALVAVGMGAVTAALDLAAWKMALAIVVEIALIIAFPFMLQRGGYDTLQVSAAGWGIGWVLAYAAVSTAARGFGSDQRRFASQALGRYLPKDVAQEIMRDPAQLSLSGEKRPIVALFTDLEGFTKLSHAISPEMVAFLLNRYLDLMTDVVLKHGGTLDKFVGDAVVAFWGAPIARPNDDERALAAAAEMFEAGERFRAQAPEGVPPIGRTRVGLHRGEAVVGNFGGEGRIQYTALGDAMNTAARLEGANKYLKTSALISGTVAARLGADTILRPMGRILVSGRSTPIEVFEPAAAMAPADRRTVAALYMRFDGGETGAVDELAAFVAARSPDPALAFLVDRMKIAGPGGTFALDSK